MSKWEEYKKKNKEARPWDMLDPRIEKVSEDIRNSRYNICLSCDRFISLTKQCKECGCIMSLKTQLPHATCPLEKWN